MDPINYICEKCNYKTLIKSNYTKHINKKYPCNNKKDKKILKINRKTCNTCFKIFSTVQSLNRHNENKCKILKELEMLRNENLLLKQQKLNDNNVNENHNNINSNNIIGNNNIINNNNIVNNNIVNNIQIFGKEDISYITKQDYEKLIISGNESLIGLLKLIYFNKEHPENQNVYISNLKNDVIHIKNDNKWMVDNKKKVLNKIYDDKTDILDEKFMKLYKGMNRDLINNYDKFFDKRNEKDDNGEIKEKIDQIKKITHLFYNHKDDIKLK